MSLSVDQLPSEYNNLTAIEGNQTTVTSRSEKAAKSPIKEINALYKRVSKGSDSICNYTGKITQNGELEKAGFCSTVKNYASSFFGLSHARNDQFIVDLAVEAQSIDTFENSFSPSVANEIVKVAKNDFKRENTPLQTTSIRARFNLIKSRRPEEIIKLSDTNLKTGDVLDALNVFTAKEIEGIAKYVKTFPESPLKLLYDSAKTKFDLINATHSTEIENLGNSNLEIDTALDILESFTTQERQEIAVYVKIHPESPLKALFDKEKAQMLLALDVLDVSETLKSSKEMFQEFAPNIEEELEVRGQSSELHSSLVVDFRRDGNRFFLNGEEGPSLEKARNDLKENLRELNEKEDGEGAQKLEKDFNDFFENRTALLKDQNENFLKEIQAEDTNMTTNLLAQEGAKASGVDGLSGAIAIVVGTKFPLLASEGEVTKTNISRLTYSKNKPAAYEYEQTITYSNRPNSPVKKEFTLRGQLTLERAVDKEGNEKSGIYKVTLNGEGVKAS